ncbi:NUAK family SNF1-like kinase 2 [Penaeus chinensis]|uniref:NUAK family SNF1-like kinase 2 n=1 Tax=Penaeus chinensis TaxID=139456 RepID=UPI001FB62A80|nr:NUAK family SNF1-like kinase 2 [Penaeus chinensis]
MGEKPKELGKGGFGHAGFQRLVGLCPKKLSLVTKYAGRPMNYYASSSRLQPEHKLSVMTQICKILSTLHQNGFVHNDIKLQNVCLSLAESGPKVTLIDYGITMAIGKYPKLTIQWNDTLPYAPEICSGLTSGVCSEKSDAYSIGQLLHKFYGSKPIPSLLSSWYEKSQSTNPSERRNLALLEQVLEEQRVLLLKEQKLN